MSPCGSTLEEQLSSIMDVLAKSAVSEISQLFSEGSASLRLQITQSRKENELLRTRMKVMRSELFSLRLQTRSNASRAASRFALARANISKPRTKSLGNDLKPLMDHKVVGHSPFHSQSKSEASSVTSPAEETPKIILIKIEEDISGCRPAEDCDAFGDRSTQSAATLESLHVDAPGSSHVSSQNTELRILSVHAQGGGQLVVAGHDTLFTAAEVEALNSPSADCSVAKSLDCGERLDCRKELAVQETPDTILIKGEEDIGGCMPPVGMKPLMAHKAVGHSPCHSPFKSEASSGPIPAEEQETPDIILIKVEEDFSGCRPADVYDAFGDRSTQSAATLESLHVDAPGSSHVSCQNTELQILNVQRQGRGKLMVEGHDTLFTASEVEALNPLSADCSVAKSLDCGERMDCRKQLAVQETQDTILNEEEEDISGCIPPVEDCSDIRDCSTQPGATPDSLHPDAPGSSHMFSPVHSKEKPYRCDQCMKAFKRSYELKTHMRIHSGEKPYRCDQCMKRFSQSFNLKIHMRIHSTEKPYRCDQCMKGFKRSYDLKIHMRVHSGEKPYRCDQCMKRFSQSFSLKIHMRIHSREKPYRCDQCMKSFSQSCHLKIHMRIHSIGHALQV